VVHAETAEGVRAATAQQETACRMVAEATERLTGNAGELRGLVGELRVAPAEAPRPADAGSSFPRLSVPALFIPDADAQADEPETRRRRRRKAALT
jgi:hypothetical protein